MRVLERDIQLLKCIPMLANISDAQLKLLAYVSQRVIFEKGETILREGDPGDEAFIICQGKAGVLKNIRGNMVRINTLGAGEVFGEMAIISSAPRSATIVADTELVVLRVTKDVFMNLMAQYPREVGLRIMQVLVDRLVQMEKKLLSDDESSGGNSDDGK